MIYILIGIILLYLFVIGSLVYGFSTIDDFKLRDLESKTKFTVVIPFRNEAAHLRALISSLFRLNYPKSLFEIILIDDDSSDNSVEIIKKFIGEKSSKSNTTSNDRIKLIKTMRTTKAPKKDAITSAIAIAKNDWIITTDADCILPKYWLNAFDEFIQTQHPNCIVAPVSYTTGSSFLNRFQNLDFLSLQAATIGGFGLKLPFLCNGANFGYKTSLFKTLNGFKGNDTIASGDDIFLLEKLKQYDAKKVNYLKCKEAVVYTSPAPNFEALIQQRIRWASKTNKQPNYISKCIGLIIFLGNLTCIVAPFLGLFKLLEGRTLLALLVIKVSIDFLLVFKITRFFNKEHLLLSYLGSAIVYPLFCVYIVLVSAFNPYDWKGRTFNT
ncbi:glycosyltransferase [uncultured Winogradskyella sp.]|uniref:glycosyltransferase n=1 Tax=uncultured Winogradskyella sp. TaxID=395353 RepID=UPI002623E4A1|nr:glycosyltransferase [uncultured Winogradskyella sp.]